MITPRSAEGACLPGFEAHGVRSINGRPQPRRQADGDYSFLVAGHLYGDPSKKPKLPPAAFVRFISEDRLPGDRFLVSLGDLVYRYAERERTMAWLETLDLPVFNAPGNHDYVDPADYERRYGPGFGHFVHGSALFVILNTEIIPWSLSPDQRRLLSDLLAAAAVAPEITAVFIFSHRVIFAANERHLFLLAQVNEAYPSLEPNDFDLQVLPLLRAAAESCQVFWFAGDVGAGRSSTLYHERDATSDLTFVATGLGDKPEDCVIRCRVRSDGEVRLAALSVEDGGELSLDRHGMEFWKARWESDR